MLGATFEAPTNSHAEALALGLPLKSLDWLLAKGAALSDLRGVGVTGRWTGVRLSPLRCGPDESGVWHLSGLGSKGFLLGPLLGKGLVEAYILSASKSVVPSVGTDRGPDGSGTSITLLSLWQSTALH